MHTLTNGKDDIYIYTHMYICTYIYIFQDEKERKEYTLHDYIHTDFLKFKLYYILNLKI